MRLKVGFILRSILVIGTFLGLVVLWSSLSPKAGDGPFGAKVVRVCIAYSLFTVYFRYDKLAG